MEAILVLLGIICFGTYAILFIIGLFGVPKGIYDEIKHDLEYFRK